VRELIAVVLATTCGRPIGSSIRLPFLSRQVGSGTTATLRALIRDTNSSGRAIGFGRVRSAALSSGPRIAFQACSLSVAPSSELTW